MSPRTADNNTNEKTTTITVKEEGPRMNTTTPSTQGIEEALEAFVAGLEGLQSTLVKFEEALLELEEGALDEEAPQHQNGQNLRLLSPSEVCEELGEESAVVYRKLSSGEIPSLKLGHALKVRWADLEEYMKDQRRHRSSGEGNGCAQKLSPEPAKDTGERQDKKKQERKAEK